MIISNTIAVGNAKCFQEYLVVDQFIEVWNNSEKALILDSQVFSLHYPDHFITISIIPW